MAPKLFSRLGLSKSKHSRLEAIRASEWNKSSKTFHSNVPSLLTDEELRMLTWIAENTAGDVCELGSFLGGSTIALAEGVRRSGPLSRRVHAFDQFRCPLSTLRRFISEEALSKCKVNGDFREVFDQHVATHSNYIVPHQGDIVNLSWSSSNHIGLLFIDMMKTWDVSDYIVSNFFTHVSEDSIMVHQDFFYDRSPWIFFIMHKLRDSFKFVGSTEKYSAIFFAVRRPGSRELSDALSAHYSPALFLEAIEAFKRETQSAEHLFMLDSASENVRTFPEATYEGQYPPMRRRETV